VERVDLVPTLSEECDVKMRGFLVRLVRGQGADACCLTQFSSVRLLGDDGQSDRFERLQVEGLALRKVANAKLHVGKHEGLLASPPEESPSPTKHHASNAVIRRRSREGRMGAQDTHLRVVLAAIRELSRSPPDSDRRRTGFDED
jgi:hypothetical protein